MKASALFAAATLVATALPGASAFAAKPCDELKAEIATKLDAKGVQGYTLEVLAPDQVGTKTVVGSCDNGAKRIVYLRT
jgi:hypothetical protein